MEVRADTQAGVSMEVQAGLRVEWDKDPMGMVQHMVAGAALIQEAGAALIPKPRPLLSS
jgi:hypothetical protein